MKRRLQRSLDVSTTPKVLEAIAECSKDDEGILRSRSCEEENPANHPSAAEVCMVEAPLPNNHVGGEVFVKGTQDLPAKDATPSHPLTPAENCGPSPYLVDVADSREDEGPITAPRTHAPVIAVSPKSTPPKDFLQKSLNVEMSNLPSRHPGSPEEALDRMLATLPTAARLRWLSSFGIQHLPMPEFILQEQCNSPLKETSSVGHLSPKPAIESDNLHRRDGKREGGEEGR
ncbi:hypothetical protein KC19_VG247700 [Ceratodon purpureus]|uniref:Uncharacterized protein n=1 Tax=Ceratodon purpureus TaxID=3225 RepID=A0A8T0HU46_CERPU|nr:hypothetical protein KC19_VG247700 [Ceratodon purpureus]